MGASFYSIETLIYRNFMSCFEDDTEEDAFLSALADESNQ